MVSIALLTSLGGLLVVSVVALWRAWAGTRLTAAMRAHATSLPPLVDVGRPARTAPRRRRRAVPQLPQLRHRRLDVRRS